MQSQTRLSNAITQFKDGVFHIFPLRFLRLFAAKWISRRRFHLFPRFDAGYTNGLVAVIPLMKAKSLVFSVTMVGMELRSMTAASCISK